ncbi:putative major outer membrane lipoprotein Oprl [Helianthus anomalus]
MEKIKRDVEGAKKDVELVKSDAKSAKENAQKAETEAKSAKEKAQKAEIEAKSAKEKADKTEKRVEEEIAKNGFQLYLSYEPQISMPPPCYYVSHSKTRFFQMPKVPSLSIFRRFKFHKRCILNFGVHPSFVHPLLHQKVCSFIIEILA